MRKIALPIVLLLSFQVAFAQQPTREEKKLLFDKIDTLLVNYIKYSRFLRGADLKISPESINNFKQLFVSDTVSLPDEMSQFYFDTQNGKGSKKPALPSGNLLKAEAGKLQNKVPVSGAANTQSASLLLSIRDSLSRYVSGLNSGRDSFYTVYNNLNNNIADYNAELDLQEKIIDRTLEEFIVMVEANYQEGFSVKLLNAAINFDDLGNNKVKVLLRKRTEGKMYGSDVKLANTDTLLLTLQVSEQYSKVRISRIDMINYKLDFLNDDDHDFMINSRDRCPDERGLFTSNGCPEKEETNLRNELVQFYQTRSNDSLTAVASIPAVDNKIRETESRITFLENRINTRPRWVITVGANTGLVDVTLTNSASGYDVGTSTTLKPENENATNNPTSKFSAGKVVGGFAMLERYFGPQLKPANFGIAAGLAFNTFLGTVKKDAFHVEYKATDNAYGARIGGNSFTQIISSTAAIEEKIAISNVAVPIVAIYRGNVTKTLGFKLEAGIAMNLYYRSNMRSTDAKFNYEAIYDYSSFNAAESGNYFDPEGTNTSNSSSWLITQKAVKDHIKEEADVKRYFDTMQAHDYPVGLGITPAKTNPSATFNVGVSFMVRPSISFYFGGSSLNLGAYFIQTKFSQPGGYQTIANDQNPVNNKTYNSLMQGVFKAKNSSYGIHISYSIPLLYPFTKWTRELSGLR